jgi:pyrophosphatase PpaX
MLRRYKAILFDMDGTLVDTVHLWDRYLIELLLDEGLLTPDRVNWFLEIRKSGRDPILTAFPELNRKGADALYDKVRRRFLREVNRVNPIIPRRELIALLDGRPAAVVTQSHSIVARHILRAADLLDLFDILVTSDKVKNLKPHPEPILRALDEIGETPAVYVGDSEADELAAYNAGIDFIHVEAVKRYVSDHYF